MLFPSLIPGEGPSLETFKSCLSSKTVRVNEKEKDKTLQRRK